MTSDLETYVEENRENIARVVRESRDSYARACAWALLDAALSEPELDHIEQKIADLSESELSHIEREIAAMRGVDNGD